MYQLVFHPKAKDEFLDSYEWYDEQRDGLADQFMLSVDNTLNRIISDPLKYELKGKNYRHDRTDVFPFVIYFKTDQNKKMIYIDFILHTSRNPNQKPTRKH